MSQEKISEVISETAPESAPLIGRPTRPYAHHLECRLRSRREADEIKTAYILAQTRLVFTPGLDDTPTDMQIAYAHRRAIIAAVNDLFGSISGAPVLAFDILKCSEVKDDEQAELEVGQVTRRFDLLIGIQRRHVDEMVAALSMITSGFSLRARHR